MARPEITRASEIRAGTGEGAIWDQAEQALYWVDIPNGLLHRFDPEAGTTRTWEMGEPIGCVALRERGGAVVALQNGFQTLDFATGERSMIHDPEAGLNTRFNDGAVDPAGRFWAGTMAMGDPAKIARFYRLDPDLSCSVWFDPVWTTNGLAFSPDGRRMYYSDSNPDVRTIWVCDYDLDSGTPTDRRVFVDTHGMAGRPDGGTVDADGCYWMAGVNGWQVVRFTPEGKVDRVVEMPIERPSRPAFGGKDLDVLFVTSIAGGLTPGTEARQPDAGCLFAIGGLGVQGVPHPRFAG